MNLFWSFLIVMTTCSGLWAQVEKGKIDVSQINFEKGGTADLLGSWKFYWKKLPYDKQGDFIKLNQSKHDFLDVPGSWGQLGKSAFGYGTMHLLITGAKSQKLELDIADIRSCHEVWCNGVKIFGDPEKIFNPINSEVRLNPLRVSLPTADSLNLFLVLSNYDYRNNGRISSHALLISQTEADAAQKNAIMSSSLMTAFLLSFFLFALALYFFGLRRDKRVLFLYFSLVCLAAAIRQASLNTNLFLVAFEDMSGHLINAFRFGSAYASVGFGIFYFNALFNEEANQRFVKYLAYSCFAATAVMFVLPISINSYLLVPMIVVMIVSTAYGVFVMAMAIRNKRTYAAVSLISIICFLLGFTNDTLVSYNILDTPYLTTYVTSLLLVVNLIIIVALFKRFEKEAVELSQRIVYKNRDLEQLAVDQVSLGDKQRQIIESLESALESTEINRDNLKGILRDWKYQARISERSSFEAQNVDRINSEFRGALKKRYPMLSSTEVEICTLARIKMSNKEIAAHRGTSEDAVRVAKSRIRKKMELDKSTVLEDVLLDLTK